MARHFNTLYTYIRTLQLENTRLEDGDRGASLLSSFRVAKLFGMLEKEHWNYNGTPWPPDSIPQELDVKAAPYRQHHYYRLHNELEIKTLLACKEPVTATLRITKQWFSAPSGVIEMPGEAASLSGNHAIMFVGYNDAEDSFHFQNSWGVAWGHKGFGKLPYGYFDTYGIEAFAQDGFRTQYFGRCTEMGHKSLLEFRWKLPVPVRGELHGIRLVDDAQVLSQEAAWAFMSVGKEWVHVEEFFVSPRYRGRGLARRLLKTLEAFSQAHVKPMCIWVSHIDSVTLGQDLLELAWKFGFHVEETNVHWASKRLIPKSIPHVSSHSKESATSSADVCRAGLRNFDLAAGLNSIPKSPGNHDVSS